MYIQGEEHYRLHSWWHAPMAELLGLWAKLTERVALHVTTLRDAADGVPDDEGEGVERKVRKQLIKRRKRCAQVEDGSYDAVIQGLLERHSKRAGWHAREKDPAFHSVPANCRPMAIPFPTIVMDGRACDKPDSAASQAALEALIADVRKMHQRYTGRQKA